MHKTMIGQSPRWGRAEGPPKQGMIATLRLLRAAAGDEPGQKTSSSTSRGMARGRCASRYWQHQPRAAGGSMPASPRQAGGPEAAHLEARGAPRRTRRPAGVPGRMASIRAAAVPERRRRRRRASPPPRRPGAARRRGTRPRPRASIRRRRARAPQTPPSDDLGGLPPASMPLVTDGGWVLHLFASFDGPPGRWAATLTPPGHAGLTGRSHGCGSGRIRVDSGSVPAARRNAVTGQRRGRLMKTLAVVIGVVVIVVLLVSRVCWAAPSASTASYASTSSDGGSRSTIADRDGHDRQVNRARKLPLGQDLQGPALADRRVVHRDLDVHHPAVDLHRRIGVPVPAVEKALLFLIGVVLMLPLRAGLEARGGRRGEGRRDRARGWSWRARTAAPTWC